MTFLWLTTNVASVSWWRRSCKARGAICVSRRAYDGVDGLRSMRHAVPDLVFLDLVMPNMDGLHLLEEMRTRPELVRVPVVLVTATSYVKDALSQQGKQIVLRRSDGLPPADVLRCLRALTSVVEPHYDEQAVPAEAGALPV